MAPNPLTTDEAVVQVYAARVAEWHGYFGVHSWIAVKRSGAHEYTIYEVTQKQLAQTRSAVAIHSRFADGHWYGNRPMLMRDLRGTGVDALIERIDAHAKAYPHAQSYRIWPGPNSNTFVAHIGRMVPELRLDLPATAVGKDYLGAVPIARTPSGTGGQVSLFGLLGVAVGIEDGLELNLFGLSFGIDLNDLGLKLPLLGHIGAAGNAEPTRLPGTAAR